MGELLKGKLIIKTATNKCLENNSFLHWNNLVMESNQTFNFHDLIVYLAQIYLAKAK